MATHVHCGSDHRNLQIHGFHVQHKRVEIIREALHNIRDHHRLRAHGNGTFGKVLAIRERCDVSAANLTNPLLELCGNINGPHIAGLRIQPNRAYRNSDGSSTGSSGSKTARHAQYPPASRPPQCHTSTCPACV